MTLPQWIEDTDNTFRATAAPIIAYITILQWCYENLSFNELSMIDSPEPGGSCWPLDTTNNDQIRNLFTTVLRALPATSEIIMDNRDISYLYRRLLQQVHEDRCQQLDFVHSMHLELVPHYS